MLRYFLFFDQMARIKLSIIIPVFNQEIKIRYALESALFQRTTFDIEIIVVDDASTDKTVSIVEHYQSFFNNLILIRNENNLGKGACFKKAYSIAQGEYFHVLDADDYFTNFDKVQKQANILDSNNDIFAVAHNTIILYPDKTLKLINNELTESNYLYENCVNPTFYHHTSSYMMRKLTQELPEAFATVKGLRGDSACSYYHAFVSKKGMKFVPDIASVYDFHGSGLWSSLDEEKKQALNLELLEALQKLIVCDKNSQEHIFLESRISSLRSQKKEEIKINITEKKITFEEILHNCQIVAGRIYDPEIYKKMFRGMHGFRLIDQLCEAIGHILMAQSGCQLLDRKFDEKKLSFLSLA